MYLTVSFRFLAFMLLILATACKEVPKDHRLPYYNTPDFTPLFLDHQEEAELLVPHQIGHFTMMDQHGDTITDTILHGKIHVANFIFTSCMSICPVMTDHMKSVSQAFGDREEVAILSFSVTPWIDTVGRLKAYAVKNNIQSKNWHLLTGDKSEIYTLARQSYFAEEDLGFTRDSTDFLHTEHVLLVDGHQRIRGIYNGTLEVEIDKMIADIRVLLEEQ